MQRIYASLAASIHHGVRHQGQTADAENTATISPQDAMQLEPGNKAPLWRRDSQAPI